MATNEKERGVPNGRYKKLESELRTELIAAQERLQQARFPTIIVLGGCAGAGAGEASNMLRQWMDSHGIAICAFESPSAEERERPEYWRYWLSLPPKGTIGIYLNGWYDRPLRDLAHGRSDEEAFKRDVGCITAFENELVVDGALLIKLWIHLDKEARQQRIADLEQNPRTRWRVNADAREGLKVLRRVQTSRGPRTAKDRHPRRSLAGCRRQRPSLRVGGGSCRARRDLPASSQKEEPSQTRRIRLAVCAQRVDSSWTWNSG